MEYKEKTYLPESRFSSTKRYSFSPEYDQKKKNSILKSFHVYLVTIHRDPCSHQIRSKIEKQRSERITQIQDAERERERYQSVLIVSIT